MKKIYLLTTLTIAGFSCSTPVPLAMKPDKNTYNSGTIGSVKATDRNDAQNPPNTIIKDSTTSKRDSTIKK